MSGLSDRGGALLFESLRENMSKLPKEYRFVDLSDYGRGPARWIAARLQQTAWTPIHVTLSFVVAGGLAIGCIVEGQYLLAAFLLVVKSILDAADGELARLKNTPSYVGRYLDSVSDILLNAMILGAVGYVSSSSIVGVLLAFLGMQLQGTLYNYYYVILRNQFQGDTTSRVVEDQVPVAFPGESQRMVTLLFRMYTLLYGLFDRAIYRLDPDAAHENRIPSWLMTLVSVFGLGFQLLLIGFFLVMGWQDHILPFLQYSTGLILVFVGIRRWMNR